MFFILLILGVYSFLYSEYQHTSLFKDDEVVIDNTHNPLVLEEDKNADKQPEVKIEDEKIKKDMPEIIGFVKWANSDPYTRVDWSHTKPELKIAVEAFEEKWGSPLRISHVYRPQGYNRHIRSVWEIWRYIHGKTFSEGYKCEDSDHIDISFLNELSSEQKDFINKEAKRHGFTTGDTPPSCNSDHALGIAVDIVPPSDPQKYSEWIKMANSVGLCHYIWLDEPHFGLTNYLPEGTDCYAY